MRQYIALVQTNPDYGLAARLPDFPALFAVAKTLGGLRGLLTEDLASHIEGMGRAGEALPEPSSFETIMADPNNQDCAAILVWARGARPTARQREAPVDSLHAKSNDEWPESEA
jgi:predicted RNase H-like HicB family nuclease